LFIPVFDGAKVKIISQSILNKITKRIEEKCRRHVMIVAIIIPPT